MSENRFKERDYKTFEYLVSMRQDSLKKALAGALKKFGYLVNETNDYITAEGDIPIALVAHMDTVFKRPVEELFYDERKRVMWSPDGLGSDDRAGVFIILKLLQSGLRPHIIFTTEEETGGHGAMVLAKAGNPFKELLYIIELDRQGINDCVFYDCDNPEFTDYVSSFGFVKDYGTFTDISILCPFWGIAGVNLSVGYRDEHSYEEILCTDYMLNTADKVHNMLTDKNQKSFKYIKSKISTWDMLMAGKKKKCASCGLEYPMEDMTPLSPNEFYCSDCIDNRVDFCSICGQPFSVQDVKYSDGICENCKAGIQAKFDEAF